MKISPVPSNIVSTVDVSGAPQPSRVDSMRTIRMTTNANPIPNDFQMLQAGQQNDPSNLETAATIEATKPLSPQLALLAKQRRALQQERREIDRQRREILSQQKSGHSAIDVSRLKSDPMSVLLENGVTYDQLTQAIINGQGNSEVNALKAEIDSLRKGVDQKFLDQNTQAEQQVLTEMGRDIDRLTYSGDEYEFVRATRSKPKVLDLIKRTYRATGEVLDVPEALRLVETELYKDANRLTKLKKMQGFLSPPPQQMQRQSTGMRTLTNRDTAQVPLSARARALAAFYGQLKK